MRAIIFTLLAVAGLSACKTPEEELAEVKAAMPAGCVMTDLGSYREIDRLVVIQCDATPVVTTLGMDSHMSGKIQIREQFAIIQGMTP